jgi:hypothetical protein
MPQIFARTADTWFRATATGALVLVIGIFLVALLFARSQC